MSGLRRGTTAIASILLLMLAACTPPPAPGPAPSETTSPDHPIEVRGDGFFDTRTGAPFVVRGVNYFQIVPVGDGFQDRFFDPAIFDANRIRADFAGLADRGYTTVRIFLDSCSVGPGCISRAGTRGLVDEVLATIAETTRIARDTGLQLILTSNDLPDGGGYTAIADEANSEFFPGYRNTVFLTREGADAAAAYWTDLLTGLRDQDAAFDAVLAWSILNEQWVFSDQPPLSLGGVTVPGADGRDYDLGDPVERRDFVTAGVSHYLETAAAAIRAQDPGGLVTMGFFAPQFPNPTSIGGTWYVDPVPLIDSSLDFLDFHAYPGSDIPLAQIAENFGMSAAAKPVVMGEVGAFLHLFDRADAAALALQQWTAESCALGFDGWLYWGYLRAPEGIGDAAWGLTDDDGALLEALAPAAWPDPCTPTLTDPDLARAGTGTASQSLPDQPPAAALDGNPATNWGSGGEAPQWFEIALPEPSSIREIRLTVSQYPAGRTTHRVEALRADGERTALGTLDGSTTDGEVLTLAFEPVDNVVAVRVTTTRSPSWVSWRSVEVLG